MTEHDTVLVMSAMIAMGLPEILAAEYSNKLVQVDSVAARQAMDCLWQGIPVPQSVINKLAGDDHV